jgi:hypothetical protein
MHVSFSTSLERNSVYVVLKFFGSSPSLFFSLSCFRSYHVGTNARSSHLADQQHHCGSVDHRDPFA